MGTWTVQFEIARLADFSVVAEFDLDSRSYLLPFSLLEFESLFKVQVAGHSIIFARWLRRVVLCVTRISS